MGRPLRVLIVEDSEEDVVLIVRALSKGGFDPAYERVETPEAMAAALRDRAWDLILADYSLPRFDAMAAFDLFRKSGLDLPFIIVSGAIGEETAAAAMKAGVHDYVIKGNLSRLLPAITRELKETENRAKRKLAEEEVVRTRQEWEDIFQAIGHPAVILDPQHGIVAANRAVLRASGLSAAEILGRKCFEVFHGRGADAPPEGCPMEKLLASGLTETVDSEMEAFGGVFLVSCTPVFNRQGRLEKIIHITTDITARKQSERERQQAVERLRKSLADTVQAMAVTVETRDPYTAGHQRRVADLARAIAREMNLADDRIEGLRLACTIHDIGKISVPAEILSKPTKLTEIEFSLIKVHPRSGYEILKDIEFPWPIARMVLEHHERIDGSGYPDRLTADDLLPESKILMVADTVEAIESYRPYRPGLGIEAALDEISKQRGRLYDRGVADSCLRLFNEKGYRMPDPHA